MSDSKETKKDLTSLTDLSHAHGGGEKSADSGAPNLLEPQISVSENDFKSLDDLDPIDLGTPDPAELADEGVVNEPENGDLVEEAPMPAVVPEVTASPSVAADAFAPIAEFIPNDASVIEDTSGPSISPDTELPDAPADGSETEEALPINPLRAAPAASGHVRNHLDDPALSSENSIRDIKNYGNQIPLGSPKLEANPAFSFFATGNFTPDVVHAIELALGSEEYGVRFEDLKVQLEQNKLFVPQISEYAAISLAQKLFDKLEHIEIDLAENIYKKNKAEKDSDSDDVIQFLNTEAFRGPTEEIHDVAAEPKAEKELFSSNLHEIENHHITRILSTLNVTEIIDAHLAESTNTPEFEDVIERVTQKLKHKAFGLGAHGVIGISFSLKPIDAHRNEAGDINRAYRLFGTGTAVRVRKKS